MNLKKSNSDFYFPMSSKQRIIIILVSLAYILPMLKCGTALYYPHESDVSRTGISLDTLVLGRKYYVKYCSSCHVLYLPESYTKQDWKINIERMQSQSNITDQEKEIILKYINTRSKE